MSTLLDLPPSVPLPRGVDLPYSDGEPMESDWHVMAMWTLRESLEHHWRDRDDFYAAGNQFFYFDPAQARNTNFRGPDFYVVKGVNREPLRKSWVVWEEGGRVPNVIVEFVSPSTADVDRVTKKKVYLQDLDVREYYCYDPDGPVLEGWRKRGRRAPAIIRPQSGRLWSEELDLFLGSWEGPFHRRIDVWPRFFDASGELILTADEASAASALASQARADAERREKDAALAELAKLRAELAALKNPPVT